MKFLQGQCNCGNVQYHSDFEQKFTAICHCRTCQRQTSSSMSLLACVDENAFHVTGETLAEFVTTGDSGQDVHRSFCSACGSPIMSRCDSIPGLTFIKAGTLDDASMLMPTIELYRDDAQSWAKAVEGAQQYSKGI